MPPVAHCVGPVPLVLKSHPVRPQIRPLVQFSGTVIVVLVSGSATQPVGASGMGPAPGVVKRPGQTVYGQSFVLHAVSLTHRNEVGDVHGDAATGSQGGKRDDGERERDLRHCCE